MEWEKNKFDLTRLGPLVNCGNGCDVDISLPSIYPFVYLHHVAFRVCAHRETHVQKSETNRVFIQTQKRKKGKKGNSTTENSVYITDIIVCVRTLLRALLYL